MKHDTLEQDTAVVREAPARLARLRAALRLRGIAKLAVVTIASAHLLTIAFECALVSAGFTPDATTLLAFRFISCALISYWLQSDSLRAYRHASQHGLVTIQIADDEPVRVAPHCPKRWLVLLHVQLDPRLLSARRAK
ncbi:conserved protein of unknown function [Burkholderia multivorans]